MKQDDTGRAMRWRPYLSELLGTAALLAGGLSVVIFMMGTGSPAGQVLPSVVLRQTITGFLFGCVGATIAVSSIGKESGAHINPAVTLGFWLMRKLDSRTASGLCLRAAGWRGPRLPPSSRLGVDGP